MNNTEFEYKNLPKQLAPMIGKKLLSVDQHTEDQFRQNNCGYMTLRFEENATLTVSLHGGTVIYIDIPAENGE